MQHASWIKTKRLMVFFDFLFPWISAEVSIQGRDSLCFSNYWQLGETASKMGRKQQRELQAMLITGVSKDQVLHVRSKMRCILQLNCL